MVQIKAQCESGSYSWRRVSIQGLDLWGFSEDRLLSDAEDSIQGSISAINNRKEKMGTSEFTL